MFFNSFTPQTNPYNSYGGTTGLPGNHSFDFLGISGMGSHYTPYGQAAAQPASSMVADAQLAGFMSMLGTMYNGPLLTTMNMATPGMSNFGFGNTGGGYTPPPTNTTAYVYEGGNSSNGDGGGDIIFESGGSGDGDGISFDSTSSSSTSSTSSTSSSSSSSGDSGDPLDKVEGTNIVVVSEGNDATITTNDDGGVEVKITGS